MEDSELIRLTRSEAIERYGVAAVHLRAQAIQRILTLDVLRTIIARALQEGNAIERGRVRWERVLPFVPGEYGLTGLDKWDLRWAAESAAKNIPYAAKSSAWWWRLWAIHGIEDPIAWIVEQHGGEEKHKRGPRGWAARIAQMALADDSATALAYHVLRRCRRILKRREQGDAQSD